jgi:uncharacterized protein (DUF433 family)
VERRTDVTHRHEHWGSIAREADPRIVVDTATTPRGDWATLVLSATAPYTHLPPIVSLSREAARETHETAVQWVRDLASAVVSDPDVCHVRPCFRRTRVWVDSLYGYVDEEGLDWQAFHADFPRVPRAAAEAMAALPADVRRTIEDLCG